MRIALILSLLALAVCAQEENFEVTEQGCDCTSDCGATAFDLFKKDWCFTDGCGFNRFVYHWDYCTYPYKPVEGSDAAKDKFEDILEKVNADQTTGDYSKAATVLTESVVTTMEFHRDEMPENRYKAIHCVGPVAPVKFVASESTPYTGLFEGADLGFIRFSSATEITEDLITPGFGLKFMVDNAEGPSLVAMPSLEGQSDFDIGKFDYVTHVPRLVNPTAALQVVKRKFRQASDCPQMVGTNHIASVNQDGSQVDKPNFPYRLIFKPAFRFPSEYYDAEGLVELFQERVPSESLLFEVYADADYNSQKADTSEKIGELYTTGEFVSSHYGDYDLFFRHEYVENDFKLRPEWEKQIGDDYDAICFSG